jgi:hypothetical protein
MMRIFQKHSMILTNGMPSMTKNYTAQQAAKIEGREYETLRKQLQRDAKKLKAKRKYPGARKCECGHTWMIPARDVNDKGDDE